MTNDDGDQGFHIMPSPGGDGGEPPAREPARDVATDGWQSYFAPHSTGWSDGPDWRETLAVVWGGKVWILLAVLLGTAGGKLAGRLVPDVYESEARVWIDQNFAKETTVAGFDLLSGEGWAEFFRSSDVVKPVVREEKLYLALPDGGNARDEPVELFRDLGVTGRIEPGLYRLESAGADRLRLVREEPRIPGLPETARRLGLESDVGWRDVPVGTARHGEPLGEGTGFRWTPDPARLAGATPLRFRLRDPDLVAAGLRERLTAAFNPNTSFLQARLEGDDPERTARTLNRFLERFLTAASEIRHEKLDRVVTTLERRAERAADRLQTARRRLERSGGAPATAMSSPTSSRGRAGGGIVAPEEYTALRQEARSLETVLDHLETASQAIESGESGDVARSVSEMRAIREDLRPEAVRTALSDLGELVDRRRKLLGTFTEKHPEVADLSAEIQRYRREALPSLLEEAEDVLSSRLATVRQDVENVRGQMRRAAMGGGDAETAWKEYRQAEDRHNQLSDRLETAQMLRSTRQPGFQVVARAAPPAWPARSRDDQLLALGSFAGLALGLGLVLLRSRMDRRIHDPEVIIHELGLPFLGIVPRLRAASPSGDRSAEGALASFRSLRSQLGGVLDRPGSVVVITSPGAGDGKSTVAANLANSYASGGRSVVLVDADLHRGNLHAMFGVADAPGLADCLLRTSEVESCLAETPVPGLHLLARGTGTGDAVEHLEGSRTDALFRDLRARFDVVVVDVPPLAAGADAPLLAERADATLLVLRAGETDRELAAAQLSLLHRYRVYLAGAVLNDVERSEPYYSYYANESYYRVPAAVAG